MSSPTHPLWAIATSQNQMVTDVERVAFVAICRLLLTRHPFSHLTPEQVWDSLVEESYTIIAADRSLATMSRSKYSEKFLRDILTRIDTSENRVLTLIKEIKDTMATKNAQQRIADDVLTLKTENTAIKSSLDSLKSSQSTAFSEMETALADLRNNAGSGDATAINASLDELESSLNDLKQSHADLDTAAATAKSEADAQAPPAPPSPFTISPTTATVSVGATQQFSASEDSNFAAGSGSIDANGLYTAPASPGTDTVTAVSKADATRTQSASVTILDGTQQPPPTV